MVPLALPEGERARNPQDRERLAVGVSPEAVMGQGFRGTPRSAPPTPCFHFRSSPFLRQQWSGACCSSACNVR